MHALIPYAISGGLDLYYYPNGLPGTAIATKELSELPNAGSSNDVYSSFDMTYDKEFVFSIGNAFSYDRKRILCRRFGPRFPTQVPTVTAG
jgi:hypothetical protein